MYDLSPLTRLFSVADKIEMDNASSLHSSPSKHGLG